MSPEEIQVYCSRMIDEYVELMDHHATHLYDEESGEVASTIITNFLSNCVARTLIAVTTTMNGGILDRSKVMLMKKLLDDTSGRYIDLNLKWAEKMDAEEQEGALH